MIERIVQLAQENGGVTFDLRKGEAIGAHGCAVSLDKDLEYTTTELTRDEVARYIARHWDEFATGTKLGIWKDGDLWYLDGSQVVDDKCNALDLARIHNQLAIYDQAKGEEIRL